MPRQNSSTWNIADPITALRLNDFNDDLDDIYANGNDRLKVWVDTGLTVNIGAGNYRIGSTEGTYAGGSTAVTDDAVNYISLTAAGILDVATGGWNTNYLRLAKVTAAGGVITDLENWKPDGVGGVLGGGGFKNITSTTYTAGFLTSFTADGVTFTITYNPNGNIKTVTNGANTWVASYDNDGNITGLVES